MIKRNHQKIYVALFMVLVLAFLLPSLQLAGYAATPVLVKVEKTVDVQQTFVGKEVSINYRLYGDNIVMDPQKDIALVVDNSGSMDWTLAGRTTYDTTQKRITMLKNAAKTFVAKWKDRNANICIVPFSTYVTKTPTMISMKDSDCLTKLNSQIDSLDASGDTNLGDGMRVAYYTLKNFNADSNKYIVTLTDGDPNRFSCQLDSRGRAVTSTYYTADGKLVTSTQAISDTTKGLTYATSIIGNMIFTTNKFSSFVIGFATPSNLVSNLNSIGRYSGAKQLSNGNYFYSADSAQSLNDTYSAISETIKNDIPFTYSLFSEFYSKEITVSQVSGTQGYSLQDNYTYTDTQGVSHTGTLLVLNPDLVLTRAYPDATTYPENQTYTLKEVRFSIKIVFTSPGAKTIAKIDTTVNYTDPFNGTGAVHSQSDFSINVLQPVEKIDLLGDGTLIAGKAAATVTANVQPINAYDTKVKGWTIKEYDSTGAMAPAGTIAQVTYLDPLKNTSVSIKGLKPGRVEIQAESSGTDLNSVTVKSPVKTINVIPVPVESVTLQGPDTVGIPKAGDNTVSTVTANIQPSDAADKKIKNWIIKEYDVKGAVAPAGTIVQVTYPDSANNASVNVKGLKPGRVEIQAESNGTDINGATVKSPVKSMSVSWVPVSGVTLDGPDSVSVPKTGDNTVSTITASVQPANAYDIKVKNWTVKEYTAAGAVAPAGTIVQVTYPDAVNNASIGVKGLKLGRIEIQAEADGMDLNGNPIKSPVKSINVVWATVASLTLQGPDTVDIPKGGTSAAADITATVLPADAYDTRIKDWIIKAYDEKGNSVPADTIAQITYPDLTNNASISVVGINPGRIEIQAESDGTDAGGATVVSPVKTLTINPSPVGSVTLQGPGTLFVANAAHNTTATINATLTPSTAYYTNIKSWSIKEYDTSGLLVSPGTIAQVTYTDPLNNASIEVKGLNPGRIEIQAESFGKGSNGSTVIASKTIVIEQPVDSVTITPQPIALFKGDTAGITATVGPSSAQDTNISAWSSSASSVATVTSDSAVDPNKATITGMDVGLATISATSEGTDYSDKHVTANCYVTVVDAGYNGGTISLKPWETTQILVYTSTGGAPGSIELTWDDSHSKIAQVDSYGRVKGLQVGTTQIKVTATYIVNGVELASKEISITVTVGGAIIDIN